MIFKIFIRLWAYSFFLLIWLVNEKYGQMWYPETLFNLSMIILIFHVTISLSLFKNENLSYRFFNFLITRYSSLPFTTVYDRYQTFMRRSVLKPSGTIVTKTARNEIDSNSFFLILTRNACHTHRIQV